MLTIALVIVKNVFFRLKKGISELLHWVAPKHTALDILLQILMEFISKLQRSFFKPPYERSSDWFLS